MIKIYRTIIVVFSLSLLLHGCATTVKDSTNSAVSHDKLKSAAIEDIREGDEQLSEGNLDTALVKYLLALEKKAESPSLFYKIGTIHRLKKNHDPAIIAYKRALAINAEHSGSIEGLGLVLLKDEKIDQAVDLLKPLTTPESNRWQALSAMGVISDLKGKHATAQKYFRRAIKIKPRASWLHNNLGYSYYLAGDFDSARKSIIQSIELEPELTEAWSNLALVYARQNNYARARNAFEQVVDSAAAANNIGYLKLLLDDPDAAVHDLQDAIENSPKYYEVAQSNLNSAKRQATRHSNSPEIPIIKVATFSTHRPKIIGTPTNIQTQAEAPKPSNITAAKKNVDTTSSNIRELQTILKNVGFYDGDVDGYAGEKTLDAVSNYRVDNGLPANREINRQLLRHLGIVYN